MGIFNWLNEKREGAELEFDKTQINSLLSILLDGKTTQQTLELKVLLESEFNTIMQTRSETREIQIETIKTEIENIKNYLRE